MTQIKLKDLKQGIKYTNTLQGLRASIAKPIIYSILIPSDMKYKKKEAQKYIVNELIANGYAII